MAQDSPDNPKIPGSRRARPGSEPALRPADSPPQDTSAADIDPAMVATDEDDEVLLPEVPEEGNGVVPEGPLAVGHAAIEYAMRLAPTSPGVYRMLNAASDVLYVGKAKNVRKRLASYARVSAPKPARILRMIAATVTVEIISTSTETEALLLEANLIKQLRSRCHASGNESPQYLVLVRARRRAREPAHHPQQTAGPLTGAPGAISGRSP